MFGFDATTQLDRTCTYLLVNMPGKRLGMSPANAALRPPTPRLMKMRRRATCFFSRVGVYVVRVGLSGPMDGPKLGMLASFPF